MKLLSSPLYFLIKIGIIVASVVILVYISKTKVIQDSKSKVKDSIKEKIPPEISKEQQKKIKDNKDYLKLMLPFYNLLVQCNITAVITIIVFFVGMLIRYFTKIKIGIKFILKLLILGLLISFITIANGVNYIMNIENYTIINESLTEEKNLLTMEELLIKKENKYRNEGTDNTGVSIPPNKEVADKFENLLKMLHVARTTSYISFGLITFLLVTEIYK
jgi:Zn-dependent membrane protease YugP